MKESLQCADVGVYDYVNEQETESQKVKRMLEKRGRLAGS